MASDKNSAETDETQQALSAREGVICNEGDSSPVDCHTPLHSTLPIQIAQEPIEPRDHSRLMVVRRDQGTIEHRRFFELPELLAPGDLLVLNDTRVLAARLLGHRSATGGKWEGLFLRTFPDGTWEMMCQTRGSLLPGETIDIADRALQLTLVERLPERTWRVRPNRDDDPATLLQSHGHMPLPPYIRKGQASAEDRDRYQTVYATRTGAVAAPTAGLHFTPELFQRLEEAGIARTTVTLHVGLGTFQPIQVADVRDHAMHAEWGDLPSHAVDAIRACRLRGGRIVAVGTTSVRVLETVALQGELQSWTGETRLFIYAPFSFRITEAMITNFHLPGTTLLLLVSAFAGGDLMQRAYETAMEMNYRFYSYGDAMLIL